MQILSRPRASETASILTDLDTKVLRGQCAFGSLMSALDVNLHAGIHVSSLWSMHRSRREHSGTSTAERADEKTTRNCVAQQSYAARSRFCIACVRAIWRINAMKCRPNVQISDFAVSARLFSRPAAVKHECRPRHQR